MTDYELSSEYLEMCQTVLSLDQRNLLLDFLRWGHRYISMAKMTEHERALLKAGMIVEAEINSYGISARGVRWLDVNDRFMVGHIKQELSREKKHD